VTFGVVALRGLRTTVCEPVAELELFFHVIVHAPNGRAASHDAVLVVTESVDVSVYDCPDGHPGSLAMPQ
jgi:hypothetical protein